VAIIHNTEFQREKKKKKKRKESFTFLATMLEPNREI
jgi:hypothetical protein